MKNLFPEYVEIRPPLGDATLGKWRQIQWTTNINDHGLSWPDVFENNKMINARIQYRLDPLDLWQSPKETILQGVGDCEDYAILKFDALHCMGIPRIQMALVLGTIAGGEDHAFLVVELGGVRRVLDNKFDQLIAPHDYINFIPKKLVYDEEVFIYSKLFSIADKQKGLRV